MTMSTGKKKVPNLFFFLSLNARLETVNQHAVNKDLIDMCHAVSF